MYQNALNFIYYAINKFLIFLFNDFKISNNVSFGWVIIAVFTMGITIKSLLNVVSGVEPSRAPKEHIHYYGGKLDE